MRPKRIVLFALVALQLVFMLSCSHGDFKGYAKEDLSKYIKTGVYKGLTYTLKDKIVAESDVELEISKILSEHTETVKTTDRAVEASDIAVVSYKCVSDGETVDELCADHERFEMWYTYNTVYESEIINSIIGRVPGDSFEYKYKFADDFILPELSDPRALMGKEVIFSVSIEYIEEELTPSLTDEFVKKVAPDCNSVSEYRDKIRAELEVRFAKETEVEKQTELWDKVMESFEVIKYPESELEYYKNMMYNAYESYAEQNNYYSLEYFLRIEYGKPIEVFEEETEEYAKDVVKELLVLYTIKKAEGISVSDEEYAAAISSYVSSAETFLDGDASGSMSADELEEYYGKETIENAALREKVIRLIAESATPEG